MPYIKLLTVLTALALLTACGGAAAPETKTDDSGGDNPCKTNAFQAECNASDPAIIALRETQCLADTNIDPTCVGETGIATVFCKDTPFDTNCNAVETAIVSRQNMCLTNDAIHSTCGAVIVGVCEANPFQTTACLPGETYLPNRIAACIKYSELDMADKGNCRIITTDTAMNTMLTDCLENPFATACESVPAFMSSFADARTNLASFCDDSDNATDDLCKGESQMRVCGFDPFTAICFTGTTYLSNRVNNCITAGNAGETKCDTVFTESESKACLANPFTDACASNTDFGTYANMARTNRLTFCDDNANVANTLCMGESQMGVCGSNPFNASCFADATYLPARLTDCITTASTEAEKCNTLLSDSTMNTAITACLTNPFTDTCASNADFMTHAETAQTNRESFCGVSGNESKDPCTALTACQGNPFGAGCEAYFAPARITDCITVASTEATKCDNIFSDSTMNTAITACIDNPFTPACGARESAFTTYAKMARDNRVSFCEANDSNALCIGANLMTICGFNAFSTLCTSGIYLTNRQVQCVAGATHTSCTTLLGSIVDPTDITGITTPTGVIDHADLPATLLEAVADTAIESHFVSVGVGGIDTTGLTGTPLTLSRAGDAMDGVTYVRGIIERVAQSFVGLLPSTNLGAPLPSNTADATWAGSYYALLNDATHDITFTIDFGAGTIDATDTQAPYTTTFDLDFTAAGVITGSVRFEGFGLDDTAPARGLIGEQGLVGGFANTDRGQWGSNLYGGFVADNPNYTPPE